MTGIFRANNPLNTFLLFVYGILLKFVFLFHSPVPVVQKTDGFLFADFINAIKPYLDPYPSIYFIITYILLFTQAVSFNQLLIGRRLIQKPNYLPAMSYLLITSFFAEWNVLSAPLIINSILIWVWSSLSNLNNNHHAKSTLFNVGIATGICTFFYLPAFAFSILLILSLMITRPMRLAEWLITFIGIFTPWYFLASWLFFTNKLYSFRLSGFGISKPFYHSFTPELAGISLIVLMIIIGGFYVRSFISKQLLQVRKNWVTMLIYLLVALAIPFINLNFNITNSMLALIPASAFIACAFYYPRIKWIPMVLQWIMVGFVIYMEYFTR